MINTTLHKELDTILGLIRKKPNLTYATVYITTNPIDTQYILYKIEDDTHKTPVEITSDSNRFELAEGTYKVIATKPGYSLKQETISITKGDMGIERTVYINLEPEVIQEVTVVGTVMNARTKESISNLVFLLTLGNKDGESYSDETRRIEVDEQGTFSFNVPINRKYILSLTNTPYKDFKYFFTTSIEYLLVNNKIRDLGNIYLIPPSEIDETTMYFKSITVYNALTGNGVGGAKIKIYNDWGSQDIGIPLRPTTPSSGILESTTGNDGTTNTMLTPGYYTLEVTKDTYKTAYYNFYLLKGNNDSQTRIPIIPASSLTADGLQFILTWGETPQDLDFYTDIYNSGEQVAEVSYQNFNYSDNDLLCVNLDVDDTDKFGPETVTIYYTKTNYEYLFYVHDFSGEVFTSEAKIEVLKDGVLITTINVDTSQGVDYKYWNVAKYNSNTKELQVINELSDSPLSINN